MIKRLSIILLLLLPACVQAQDAQVPFICVLGITQDGGFPHMGCAQAPCIQAYENPARRKHVVSLALVDPVSKKWWLLEATPDIKDELYFFQKSTQKKYNYLPDGIFITHAHIGHYTGLMEFGREVMNTKSIPVYVLPKLKAYLENNGPWSQLVALKNIVLTELTADNPVALTGNISLTAFTVPHRDEFSETAGFRINAGSKKYLFIPDVNKWDKWDRSIVKEVQAVDVAFLDATFYDNTELQRIKMSEVPHPLVSESLALFANTGKETISKIYFIHFNHTNPLLWDDKKQKEVKKLGFNLAYEGERL